MPLTLIVLVVYLAFIPFRFWEPFQNRDVLIIYNGMLFAVTLDGRIIYKYSNNNNIYCKRGDDDEN